MHARSTARSAGPLRLALRRIPFTLGLIGLLVTVAVLILGGPWILGQITDYTIRLYQAIPGLIG